MFGALAKIKQKWICLVVFMSVMCRLFQDLCKLNNEWSCLTVIYVLPTRSVHALGPFGKSTLLHYKPELCQLFNQKTQAARLPILSASFGGNGSTHWFGQVITNSPQHHLQSPCRAMKVLWLVLLCVVAASCKRGGRGRRGPRECGAGGPQPTCSDGQPPISPCADGGRPR